MIRQIHQKSVFNDVDEPKSSARIRCLSSNQSNINEIKSVKKECSNKFLRPFSPKKNLINEKKSNTKIENIESNDQNILEQNEEFFIEEKNCLSSNRALKTIDTNRNTNRKNLEANQKILISSEKPIKNQQSLIEKFQLNETKIILMRQQLEKVFSTFKSREKEMQEKKSELKNKDKIKAENEFLSKEIARVQEMIKEALLEREKLKHGPINKRTKR